MKQLQIISFNIPYPPDYGGVIDVYYKIKALNKAGVKIILHCFEYGRIPAKELENLCEKVYYYPRKRNIVSYFSKLPFIVKTRNNFELIKRIQQYSDIPILAEGLHCTYPLYVDADLSKKFFIRTHNVEHQYYSTLAEYEPNFVKKFFFKTEAHKLKNYESILSKSAGIAAISKNDAEYFKFINSKTQWIAPFHPFEHVAISEEKGEGILIHGDLSISENVDSILWLMDNVLNKVAKKIIIAGKNPQLRLQKKIALFKNIELIANPPFDRMQQLIQQAQIHLIYSLKPHGMKLKLLNVLYNGRHVVCNPAVVNNSGLESLCNIAEKKEDIVAMINDLIKKPFDVKDINLRKEILYRFSNENQAQKLMTLLNL